MQYKNVLVQSYKIYTIYKEKKPESRRHQREVNKGIVVKDKRSQMLMTDDLTLGGRHTIHTDCVS